MYFFNNHRYISIQAVEQLAPIEPKSHQRVFLLEGVESTRICVEMLRVDEKSTLLIH